MYDNLPDTAIGTLRLFASTQCEVDKFSDDLIQSVKSGDVNPIELLVMLRAFEKVSDRVLKEIRENTITEANKYNGSSFKFNGNKIEKSELGTKYDFSICNDPDYNKLFKTALESSEKLKEREVFLKSLKEPITLVNRDSGEVYTIIPPLKTSTSGLKVSIK